MVTLFKRHVIDIDYDDILDKDTKSQQIRVFSTDNCIIIEKHNLMYFGEKGLKRQYKPIKKRSINILKCNLCELIEELILLRDENGKNI